MAHLWSGRFEGDPDAELFAAAGRGDLTTKDGVIAQASRLLDDKVPTETMMSALYSVDTSLSSNVM